MARFTRRGLVLGAGAFAGASLLGSRSLARTSPRSPNEQVRVAIAGVRGRGRDHMAGFARLPNVKVVALCDVDSTELGRAKSDFEKDHDPVDAVADVRRLLDRTDVDALSIATPNHWHALQGIWACQAGKDVYVEKPVSHDVYEGSRLVAAARAHGRVVQAGMQSRSSFAIREALEWLHAGNLGGITCARGLCYKPRKSIGKVDRAQSPPASVDYDAWCGPAPLRPLARANLHYDWHWLFDTGNGDLGNQGVHQMDLARWALGESGFPRRVVSLGGRVGYCDDGDTPNTQVVLCDYGSAPLLFEVRGLPQDAQAQTEDWNGRMDRYLGAQIGVIVHCEGGTLRIPDYQSASAHDGAGVELKRWEGADDHYGNFISTVRSRTREDLAADVREGHVSSALCHLGNASYRLASLARGPLDAPEVLAEAEGRLLEHCGKNGVPAYALRTGAWLEVDPEDGPLIARVDGAPELAAAADALLHPTYRAPYLVPEHP
jgi:predicted dehydrogenase